MAANAACTGPAPSGTPAACGAPRRHTMPSAQATVKRGGGAGRTSVSQSLSPTGHSVRRTFAEGVTHVGTIGEFPRKMARPAGLEPATIGLEGRAFRSGGTTRNKAVQRVVFGVVFRVVFRSIPGAVARPYRTAGPRDRPGGKTDGPRPRRARAAAAHGPWRGPHPPPAAVDIRPIRRSARTRSSGPHRSPRLPVVNAHSASLSRPTERGSTDGRTSAAVIQEGPLP